MNVIVSIAGFQYKITPEVKYLYVSLLSKEVGETFNISDVLLVDNNGSVNVGKPLVAGASVNATVLSHVRGDKVIVFKKKRRKGYKKKNGHRQNFTKIQIDSVNA